MATNNIKVTKFIVLSVNYVFMQKKCAKMFFFKYKVIIHFLHVM